MSEQQIARLKELMQRLPGIDAPTRHFLVDGMYLRQMRVAAHTAIVGRRHKKPHFFLCLAGGAWVVGADEKPINIRAGMVWVCSPGEQRVGVTYADTVFATIHRTDKTDLQDIENDCAEFEPASKYGLGNVLKVELPDAEA